MKLVSAEAGSTIPAGSRPRRGLLVVNADDWGRDTETTDRTLECIRCGAVSSVSAMVFMGDSRRAAEIAREHDIDAGLHLNFTMAFSTSGVPNAVVEHQRRVSAFLWSFRLAQVIYHPGLARTFEYLVTAQCEEFRRLYGEEPRRLDGHHHMHLCANVMGLLPEGTVVRRNFTFQAGEKSFVNRIYRERLDRRLARRHVITDFLFSLPPMEPANRLTRILSRAQDHTVELETHPVKAEERNYLMREVPRWVKDGVPVAARFDLAGYVAGGD